jgi:hypothetical protein
VSLEKFVGEAWHGQKEKERVMLLTNEGDEPKSPRSAGNGVFHNHRVLNGAKIGKVAVQLLIVCAIAQTTDE